MFKATAVSPANIAFVKYWGQRDRELMMPYHGSVSMNLNACFSTTTVEFSGAYTEDRVSILDENGEVRVIEKTPGEARNKDQMLFAQIERVRQMAGVGHFARIVSQNSFPSDSGVASSASGFSALTVAALAALERADLIEDKVQLSRIIRLGGSLSAMRSIYDGFSEICLNESGKELPERQPFAPGGAASQKVGKVPLAPSDDCFSLQVTGSEHWDLIDVVAVLEVGPKAQSSTSGHLVAETSEFFESRIQRVPERIDICREAILERNIEKLGLVAEADTLSMHCVMMTSNPPCIYWNGATIELIKLVREWRVRGLRVYFSIDAGSNVHLLCESRDLDELKGQLAQVPFVKRLIVNKASQGTHLTDNHLF